MNHMQKWIVSSKCEAAEFCRKQGDWGVASGNVQNDITTEKVDT